MADAGETVESLRLVHTEEHGVLGTHEEHVQGEALAVRGDHRQAEGAGMIEGRRRGNLPGIEVDLRQRLKQITEGFDVSGLLDEGLEHRTRRRVVPVDVVPVGARLISPHALAQRSGGCLPFLPEDGPGLAGHILVDPGTAADLRMGPMAQAHADEGIDAEIDGQGSAPLQTTAVVTLNAQVRVEVDGARHRRDLAAAQDSEQTFSRSHGGVPAISTLSCTDGRSDLESDRSVACFR